MTADELREMCVARRTELKLTQIELSKLSGINQSTLCHIENNRVKLNLVTLFKLLDALQLDFVISRRANPNP